MSDTMTKAELRAAVKATGSYFFQPATMRFFHSVLETGAQRGPNGPWYFVTSERFDEDSPRFYTVRTFDPSKGRGCTGDVGGFQAHRTLEAAKEALRAAIQAQEVQS